MIILNVKCRLKYGKI